MKESMLQARHQAEAATGASDTGNVGEQHWWRCFKKKKRRNKKKREESSTTLWSSLSYCDIRNLRRPVNLLSEAYNWLLFVRPYTMVHVVMIRLLLYLFWDNLWRRGCNHENSYWFLFLFLLLLACVIYVCVPFCPSIPPPLMFTFITFQYRSLFICFLVRVHRSGKKELNARKTKSKHTPKQNCIQPTKTLKRKSLIFTRSL